MATKKPRPKTWRVRVSKLSSSQTATRTPTNDVTVPAKNVDLAMKKARETLQANGLRVKSVHAARDERDPDARTLSVLVLE
jgi:hypothetical protein